MIFPLFKPDQHIQFIHIYEKSKKCIHTHFAMAVTIMLDLTSCFWRYIWKGPNWDVWDKIQDQSHFKKTLFLAEQFRNRIEQLPNTDQRVLTIWNDRPPELICLKGEINNSVWKQIIISPDTVHIYFVSLPCCQFTRKTTV